MLYRTSYETRCLPDCRPVEIKYGPGTVLYAFHYKETKSGGRILNRCAPVQGMLATSKDPDAHDRYMKLCTDSDTDPIPTHFIPYGKDGKPAWNRAVRLYHRLYADSDAEAWDAYIALMDSAKERHTRQTEKLENELSRARKRAAKGGNNHA